MADPLFPIKPLRLETENRLLDIEPYRHDGAWVFDEPRLGLHREPFVAGITEMIDRLVACIPDAAAGFRLSIAEFPFDGHQTSLTWVRADPVEGHWYRAEDQGDEGWLCPALFCFFAAPPAKIYVRTEPKQRAARPDQAMG